jgi:hypothetical protein
MVIELRGFMFLSFVVCRSLFCRFFLDRLLKQIFVSFALKITHWGVITESANAAGV